MPQDFSSIPEPQPDLAVEYRPGRRSIECADLFAAIAKAQGEIEGAKKDSTNPHFKSSYADLASVRDVTREPLAKHGLAVLQWPRTVENGVEIETILTHLSGQFMSGTLWVPCSKFDAQGIGSAITYGRRYALMAVTGVAPVDDDGNAAVASYKPTSGAIGPRQSSENGRRMAADDPHLVDASRQKGTVKGGATAADRAKTWADNAIATLNLSDHTVESLSLFLNENDEKIKWLESNAPLHHDRFFTAYDYAAERARAKIPS